MTGPGDVLARVGTTCHGWRAWRTRDSGLAARKGGTPPGVQARGTTLRELKANIAAIETAAEAEAAGEPDGPLLRPNHQAVLAVLENAAGPLTARAISDASGVALSSTGTALAALGGQGLVTRRRKGRTWLYRRKRRPGRAAGDVERRLGAAAATIGQMPAAHAERQLDRLEARAGAR